MANLLEYDASSTARDTHTAGCISLLGWSNSASASAVRGKVSGTNRGTPVIGQQAAVQLGLEAH